MSLVNKTELYQRQVGNAVEKPQSRGFLLALVCMALFLLLANVVFPPKTDGPQQTNAVWLVGP